MTYQPVIIKKIKNNWSFFFYNNDGMTVHQLQNSYGTLDMINQRKLFQSNYI